MRMSSNGKQASASVSPARLSVVIPMPSPLPLTRKMLPTSFYPSKKKHHGEMPGDKQPHGKGATSLMKLPPEGTPPKPQATKSHKPLTLLQLYNKMYI